MPKKVLAYHFRVQIRNCLQNNCFNAICPISHIEWWDVSSLMIFINKTITHYSTHLFKIYTVYLKWFNILHQIIAFRVHICIYGVYFAHIFSAIVLAFIFCLLFVKSSTETILERIFPFQHHLNFYHFSLFILINFVYIFSLFTKRFQKRVIV